MDLNIYNHATYDFYHYLNIKGILETNFVTQVQVYTEVTFNCFNGTWVQNSKSCFQHSSKYPSQQKHHKHHVWSSSNIKFEAPNAHNKTHRNQKLHGSHGFFPFNF